MSRLYHVTKASNAEDIWNDGLKNKPPSESWVESRQRMRSKLDNQGREQYNNWVDRENAIFFWTTHNSAIRYADKFLDPAIIEVHDVDGLLWCLPNYILEDVFSDFISDSKNIQDDQLKYIINSARVWNGDRNDDLEVWTQPTVSPNKIHQIYDYEMNPLDFSEH